jgi:hypothetical protein
MKKVTPLDFRNTTERTNVTRSGNYAENVSFGFSDNKGRELGVQIVRYVSTFINDDGSKTKVSYRIPAGEYLTARVTATRGGEIFGATQGENHFATVGDMEAWIAQRIEGTKKAYLKKFAKEVA